MNYPGAADQPHRCPVPARRAAPRGGV